MAGYVALKMKRKDMEEVNDEFSDFSLCSPARKIRRLDAELPPIMEEDEPVRPILEQSMSELSYSDDVGRVRGPVIEELPSENEERAIVLFIPMKAPLLKSPSNFSVHLSSDVILGFKNQILRSNQYNQEESAVDEATSKEENSKARTNESLAVIPWNPSQLPPNQNMVPQTEISESMEADEEMEPTSMDIEDNNNNIGAENGEGIEYGGTSLHQWHQQHCMIPQLPQTTPTPIVWYR